MFFFFRAEDGIRDHCVTGVQTCALPIFLRGTPNEDQTYSVNPSEGRERLLEGMDLVIKALTEPQPFAWEGRYYQFRTVAEIGRASCRERVWIWVAAAACLVKAGSRARGR